MRTDDSVVFKISSKNKVELPDLLLQLTFGSRRKRSSAMADDPRGAGMSPGQLGITVCSGLEEHLLTAPRRLWLPRMRGTEEQIQVGVLYLGRMSFAELNAEEP